MLWDLPGADVLGANEARAAATTVQRTRDVADDSLVLIATVFTTGDAVITEIGITETGITGTCCGHPAHDKPPVDSNANAICCGVACQFATFHGDEPEFDRVEVLNEFVRSRNGWVTSVPGDVDVTIECLPGSTLPDELQVQGYDLTATGDGERILPTAIIERFCIGADGVLEPLTSGSPARSRRSWRMRASSRWCGMPWASLECHAEIGIHHHIAGA
jgi:hypothetical protein